VTYLWLRGRHPLLIGFLVVLYGAIAWHFWYVTVPVLAIAVCRALVQRAVRAGPKNVPTTSQNGTPAKAGGGSSDTEPAFGATSKPGHR
jgi:hypothetical protein